MKSQAEWLETDGLGGFASGAADGIRTRRYHALLLAAMRPPTERFVLVNGCDAAVETPAGTFALSSQMYIPNGAAPTPAPRASPHLKVSRGPVGASNWPTGRMSSTRFLCGTAILWSL